jgi:hypothetical protein
MPAVFLVALAALATLSAFPGISHAAPVIETQAARELACVAGSVAPECLRTASIDDGVSAFGLLKAGGLLLSSAAASAIHASESITPVPLPAAGWLLVAGLGSLGLFGRRRQDALPTLRPERGGIEPISAALRGGVRGDMPAPLRTPSLIRGFSLRDRLRDLMLTAEGLTAFAPGRTSPDRPCGGAGMLWDATAERAPPALAAVERAAGVLPRAVRHGRAFAVADFPTRLQGWISSLAARFLRVCDASLAGPAIRPVPVSVQRAANQNGLNPHAIRSLHRAQPGAARPASNDLRL